MNLLELKQQVMFQTGNDADDLGDFQPHLTDYLNEGYDRLMMAYVREHIGGDGDSPELGHDKSRPELPEWLHRAIADYATWLVYRNGSAEKQSRGFVFRKAFEEAEMKARTFSAGKYITHIPM
ncbi:MAG: hypothetical protein PUD16_07485 [bacterium]|nr:hypothetical protein [bacterium]